MGPNDPFSAQRTSVETEAPSSAEDIRPRGDGGDGGDGDERRRRIGTAIGAGLGLAFGLLVVLVGLWTALLLALVAAIGAGVGRLIGARRALETWRRIVGATLGLGRRGRVA